MKKIFLALFIILITISAFHPVPVIAAQSRQNKYLLVQESENGGSQSENNPAVNEQNNNPESTENQELTEEDFQKLLNIDSNYYHHIEKLISIFTLSSYLDTLSPLKRKIYMRSPEYKKVLDKQKILQKRLMEAEFTLHIPFQREYFLDQGIRLKSEYNVRLKRFELFIGKRSMVIKSLAGPWIESKIPITTYEAGRFMENSSTETFFGLVLKMPLHHFYEKTEDLMIYTLTNLILYYNFNVSEETALKIEEHGGEIKIFFRLLGDIKMLRQDNLTQPKKYYYYATHKNRIEIIHRETNEVLYKKQY